MQLGNAPKTHFWRIWPEVGEGKPGAAEAAGGGTAGQYLEQNKPENKKCAYRFDSALWQIVICLCVAWNRVTNSVHQGSLWEGAVSQRLTEGESPGFFDAVSYEALVIDQRSLPQSASRPVSLWNDCHRQS